MEWRQQSSLSHAEAFQEAQRWIENVTGKSFGSKGFRAALENGVLLCDLINQLKPGLIKRVNRLSTPIAGLDNMNVFLKACAELGLNEAQLFHSGDLQDLSTRVTLRRDESNRRLKNVLITIYWLGRKAQLDPFYHGPQLNFKAFEGLLGLALSKALDEGSNVLVKESEYKVCCNAEIEEFRYIKSGKKREDSVDNTDSLDTQGLCPVNEGCGVDTKAEEGFRMEARQPSAQQRRDYIPSSLLRRKQRRQDNGKGCTSPLTRACQIQVRPGRPLQVNPGWIWSKSLSDIPMVYPVQKIPDGNDIFEDSQDPGKAIDYNEENARKSSVTAKDGEAKWQDDLKKWKNRRRSTNSDLLNTLQDRQHVIDQMSYEAACNLERNETQRGLLNRSSSSGLRPHTRVLLARSHATEAPYNPHYSAHTQGSSFGAMLASDRHIVGEETHSTSLTSDRSVVTTPLDCPFGSQTQVKTQIKPLGSPAPFQATSEFCLQENGFSDKMSSVVTTVLPNETTKLSCSTDSTANLTSHKEISLYTDPQVSTFFDSAVNKAGTETLKDFSHQNQGEAQKASWEQVAEQGRGQQAAGLHRYFSRTGSWSGSASLPRGYRRSEGSSRLSAAITARPFGTKQSRVSSLPRLCNVDDNQSLLFNSEWDGSLQTTKSTLKREVETSQMRTQFQASVRPKANQAKQSGTEQREEGKSVGPSSPNNGYHHQPCTQTQLLLQPSILQSNHNKNLTWASSVATNIPKVDHSGMRVSLTLKPNSRPDFGFQTHWDSTGVRVKFIQLGSPAELCQLCVNDEIVAVDGIAVAHMSYNQWKNKMTSALQTGSLTMDIRRYGNKDWSASDGGHHNHPGQNRMTLNLTASAPVLIGCPDHHANSTASMETTVRKLSKFDGQTDNAIQGKVMERQFADNPRTTRSKVDYNHITRKNQKRRTEFFKQRGGSESAISDLQVPSLSPSSSSWSWDHENDRRRQEKWQKEQERLLQEQYRRDQERLEAEWQRAQQDALGELYRKAGNTCEMTNGAVIPAGVQLPVNGVTNKTIKDEQSPDMELKGAESKHPGLQNKISEPDWAEGSCGFVQLSPAHRAKSLSTPALASFHKQTKGDQRKSKGQGVSKAEQERQQILEEMKKRTQLLTDNSWIRQHSSNLYKEPVYAGIPMKRYESLDNLQTWRQSPVSTTTDIFPRPHSAAAGYSPPSRNSSSRYSTGGTLTQSPPVSQHHSSVWAATDILEEQRPESRFGSETGSPTVRAAISNSSMPLPPSCDLTAVLHITE